MKRAASFFRNWFSRRSMRSKLSLTFSCTIVAILLLTMVMLNGSISRNYRGHLIRTADKACDQAHSFLKNYLETMVYASDLIYYNNDLQEALISPEFNGDRSYGDQYREFLRLDKVFSAAEMVETIYQARVFIPDEIFYSYNRKHFAANSELVSRSDYQEFEEKSSREMVYFTAPEDREIPGLDNTVNLVSLLRVIRSTNGTATPIGVEEVSILTSQLQGVLERSDITSTGVVYLVNDKNQIISASEKGSGLLKPLQKEGLLQGDTKDVEQWDTQILAGEKYLVKKKRLAAAGWTLVALIPDKEITQQTTQISSTILFFSLLAVAVVCVASVLISRYYTKRLKQLTEMMRTVGGGSLKMGPQRPGADEIDQLFQNFSSMTNEITKLMQEQYKSGKAVKSAQLKALQAQINPHFLYNTLDLINWEAMDYDAPEIAEIAKSLAKFYRISLNRGHQVVTIGQEIEHVQAYVDIENHHFDGAITLKTEVPEELLGLGCLNIILQPLVENSIMHGIAESPSIQECSISVSAHREKKDIVFHVEDDGMGMAPGQLSALLSADPSDSHGYGIKNIHSRIQLSYGEEYGLSYESWPGRGTKVTIRIPALSPEEMEQRLQ